MKTYSIKGILFDMDGVLVDSNAEVEKFWRAWAVKENLILTDQIIAEHIYGRTTIDTINELFQLSDPAVKKQIIEAALVFDRNLNPALMQEAARFVSEIASAFHKIAVVTSAPLERTQKILRLNKIDRFFSHCVTGDEITRGKPDPEPYLKGASKLQLQPAGCLVFEDSNSGILSAIAAGMYVIAVNNENYVHDKVIGHINDYTNMSVHNNILNIGTHKVHIDLMVE